MSLYYQLYTFSNNHSHTGKKLLVLSPVFCAHNLQSQFPFSLHVLHTNMYFQFTVDVASFPAPLRVLCGTQTKEQETGETWE